MVAKDKTILNLANALTIARIALAPVFVYFLFNDMFLEAFIVILVATVTDFLDGHIARIWNMQTRFGKMLDPLADKVIVVLGIIALLIKFKFPLLALIVGIAIIARDTVLLVGGIIFLSRNRKKVLVPNELGKITTFFQMATIVIYVLNVHPILKNTFLVVTLVLTVLSAGVYFAKGYRLFFKKDRKRKINLPNRITMLRITLIPVFIAFLLTDIVYREYVAAFLFILLALSDALDGYIARKTNQVTSFGKLVDPLADKLLVSSALIFLIGRGVEQWMAFIIVAREFVITGLRTMALTKNQVMAAKMSGKVKTVVQIIAITAVILNVNYAYWLMVAATLITLYSGIEYLWVSRHLFKELA